MWAKEENRGKIGGIRGNEGIHRHDISDEAWKRIKELRSGQAGKHGRAVKDNRLFINGRFGSESVPCGQGA
ncbi:hypothetical protein [Treponema endosymbiont of Eucomonympha sp.]|uniref:hypothetical protein n=1 Tax=Treponema endosymbiont of Eucomonympha sp. TaxID=1580831 RepID=UPI001396C926|nr:hypothetical protein [Treponema endosymbiont of Eucomonympha sp.]